MLDEPSGAEVRVMTFPPLGYDYVINAAALHALLRIECAPDAPNTHTTAVFSSSPAKCAARLAKTNSPMASRVSTVALARCGCSTTLSSPQGALGTFGSSAKTSSPAPPKRPS